jgi:hypothetical protein
VVDHEYLMKTTDGPEEPGGLEVHGVCVAPHEVLGQDHNEPLEDDQEEILLIRLSCLQTFLHLLNLHTYFRESDAKYPNSHLMNKNRTKKYTFNIKQGISINYECFY